jgi:pyruvate,orthophosphate dikinase
MEVSDRKFRRGDIVTIDGTSGEIFAGELPREEPKDLKPEAQQIVNWAQEIKSLEIRANAEHAEAQVAADRGAHGIGLFRTEHMFLGDRLSDIQEVLFGGDPAKAEIALERVFEFSKKDFKESLAIMDGHGVTIRLLDAPLHEFFPENSHLEKEENPMLGHRSVRMAIDKPEIPRNQARAVLTAAAELIKEGKNPKPEIELPLVIVPEEVAVLKKAIAEVAVEVHAATGVWVPYALGIMVETPAAALQGKELVTALGIPAPGVPDGAQPVKRFASFGTNDLTQTTLAISRDDADRFLPLYVEDGLFVLHPFVSLHPIVERLIRIFVKDAREVDPHFEIFICGEHGGDLYTIGRLHDMGFTGSSMSPGGIYRSIIQAAHEQINHPR